MTTIVSGNQMLPSSLEYLQTSIEALNQEVEELDESTNLDALEKVLRERIDGLSYRDAKNRIEEDRKTLEAWIENGGADSPAAPSFVLGVMSYPSLVKNLMQRPTTESTEASRYIAMVFPDGFKVTHLPHGAVTLEARKVFVSVSEIDQDTFNLLEKQFSVSHIPPMRVGTKSVDQVRFGESHGYRFRYVQSEPAKLKSIQLLLHVPGGIVIVEMVCDDVDFDESIIESRLHSLRIHHD